MLNVASLIWVLLEEISLGERILNLEASIKKWLDYCLVSNDWRLCFPHVVVEVLKPHKFDHDLLFLSCCKFKSNKVHYFHFQATWISHPGYGSWFSLLGTLIMARSSFVHSASGLVMGISPLDMMSHILYWVDLMHIYILVLLSFVLTNKEFEFVFRFYILFCCTKKIVVIIV